MVAIGLNDGGLHIKADGALLRFLDECEILSERSVAANTPPAMAPEIPLRGPVSTHTFVRAGEGFAVVVAGEVWVFSIGIAVRRLFKTFPLPRADTLSGHCRCCHSSERERIRFQHKN
jgi:hypothetical protein